MKRLFLCIVLLFSGVQLHAKEVPVLESLVVADRCADQRSCTFTWTLTSLSSRAFEMAQQRYGPRDKNFQLLGIEFTDGKKPISWFPGNKEYVIIQLTESTMKNKKQALFQLGHEVMHVITPTPGGVNILEEGLATELSLDFVREVGYKISDRYIGSRAYTTALEAVRCLRDFEPQLNRQITRMRAEGHRLGTVSADVLQRALPNTPGKMVKMLALHFDQIDKAGPVIKSVCR